MEIKNLYPFVLLIVLVGMVIGVGVLTLDKFSSTTFYQRDNYNDSLGAPLKNTTRNLDWGNITAVEAVWNGTSNILPAACYELNASSTDTVNVPGHFVYYNDTATCSVNGQTVFYVIYDYKDYATETRGAVNAALNEVKGIATNWLGLIVTVAILAIILFLVVRSFGGAGVRK